MARAKQIWKVPQMPLAMTEEKQETKLIPVAAYARVSTEKEEQEDSFERQVEHYTQMILANPEWEMVEVYADPGISGTRAEKRPNFLRMIEDCRNGKIQKILVKSISRFARNTVDALKYIRELRELKVSVFFESEKIDTLTANGEVLLTILAAMAEQESRTISTNVKWGYRRKFESGGFILNTGLMLGYRRCPQNDEEGNPQYEIVEEEAEIIRRIYRDFLHGITMPRIAKALEAEGVKTKFGKTHWCTSNIKSILTNEKYAGNAISGKTYKADVLSKTRVKNDGIEAPMYYAENTHPAIIEEEMFERVKRELEEREKAKKETVGSSRFSSKYPFSGILVCGECGSKLRRHVRVMGSGEKVASWACANRIINGRSVCDSHHIRESVLEETYKAAVVAMTQDFPKIIQTVKEGAMLDLDPDNRENLDRIEKEIASLQTQTMELYKKKTSQQISTSEYIEEVKKKNEQMTQLEQQRLIYREKEDKFAEAKAWLDDFEENTMNGKVMKAMDAAVMRSLVNNITVYDDHIKVVFQCGGSIEQKYI